MTSNVLTGERRWNSARRGGMTVLGKVAVPKPINLPSQRLENHGVDPNVEIVPKGTLSWGGKSSSSTSNPWGSSGGSGSPSHPNGRPSSGGSGTRPSTAGSDRAQEATSNVWVSNSRPSSASGVSASNQADLALSRPHSAETRPGSSQLSRFAETQYQNSVAWGISGAAEKLGVTSSKKDGFSLTSGDFPTLGSEKESTGRNLDPQEYSSHSRPGSSSGAATAKDRIGASEGNAYANANFQKGTTNSSFSYGEDGIRPGMEKWQMDSPPYHNLNFPPHYDAWRGPPINNHPGAMWYRGPPPGGPPYAAPVPHGGYPMDPYPDYRPRISATALSNQQPVPPPGAGPPGHQPHNGDMYRPYMPPDAYARPGMPIRPGFYTGPVPYGNYRGPPPMVYCNPHGQRDIPYMDITAGMSAGHNAPDHTNLHSRPSRYDHSSNSPVLDQAQYSHPRDACGPPRVLLKQHDGMDRKQDQNWDGNQLKKSSWDDDCSGDYRKDKEMDTKTAPGETYSTENVECLKAYDVFEKKSEITNAIEVSVAPKDSRLIEKIEGLNAKVRASDRRLDSTSAPNREEQRNKLQDGCVNPNLHPTEANGVVSGEFVVRPPDKSFNGVETASSRRPAHGMQRPDQRGSKGRFDAREADGSVVHMQNNSLNSTDKCESHPQMKAEEEFVPPIIDSQFQRAKMKELAKQRVKQRQEEEEERAREQKAKALAKLEELNKRTQAIENINSTMENENVSSSELYKNEEAQVSADSTLLSTTTEELSSTSSLNTLPIASDMESSHTTVENPVFLFGELAFEIPKTVNWGPAMLNNQPKPSQQVDNALQVPRVLDSKEKSIIHKGKQSISFEKSSGDKHIPITEAPKSLTDASTDSPAFVEVIDKEMTTSSKLTEPSVQTKRKNNRGGKNKHKTDASSSIVSSIREVDVIETGIDETKIISKEPESNSSLIQPSEPRSSFVNEDSHGRVVNNQSKFQQSRKMKNQQANKSVEKFHGGDGVVWAPVRQQNKADLTNEVSHNLAYENIDKPSNPRNKRAEMERYVTKAAAKEIAQRANSQQSIASSTEESGKEVSGRPNSGSVESENFQSAGPAVGKFGTAVEARNGDIRQNKAGKAHGSWRQRTPAESAATGQGFQSNSSNSSKTFQKSKQQYQHENSKQSDKCDDGGDGRLMSEDSVSSVPITSVPTVKDRGPMGRGKQNYHAKKIEVLEEKPNPTDGWGIDDGWHMPENPEPLLPVTTPSTAKDHRVMGKEKRHAMKGQKGGNSNERDQKNTKNDDMDKSKSPSSVAETSQIELQVASKENHPGRERSASHWQPKSQIYSARNQGTTYNAEEAPLVGHQDHRREKKTSSFKGRSHSPNQFPTGLGERESLSNMDFQNEKAFVGFNKSGQNNSRVGRGGPESRGHWDSAGQDYRQANQPRERQGNTSHYEYQRRNNNDNKARNFEQSNDGSYKTSAARFRDGGHRTGRGNFHGHQNDAV